MASTGKKIIIVVTGLSIIGIAAFLLFRKKKSPGQTTVTPADIGLESNNANASTEGVANNIDPAPSWSYDRDPNGSNPYWAWGYVKDNQGNPVPYPRIKVFTPDGKTQYGGIYIGDNTGAWNLGIPDETYQLEISDSFDADKKYHSYKNPARVVSNGYKLFMRKLTE